MPACETCGFELPSGCTCAFEDTASVAWSGKGTATLPVRPAIRIDPDDSNPIEDSGSGLKAITPSRFLAIPRLRLRNSANQATTSGQYVTLSWDTEDYDTDGMFSVADPMDIRVRTPGLWRYFGSFLFTTNATGDCSIVVLRNNTHWLEEVWEPTLQDGVFGPFIAFSEQDVFEEGDLIQVQAFRNTTSQNVVAAEQHSPVFGMTFLGDPPA